MEGKKVTKKDYFKSNPLHAPTSAQQTAAKASNGEGNSTAKPNTEPVAEPKEFQSVQPDGVLEKVFQDAEALLEELHMPALQKLLLKLRSSSRNKNFSVSVIGEFSRGKSTLINKVLGSELLPCGNLPMTAMLTRITYNNKPMVVYVDPQNKRQAFSLEENSWRNLVVGKENQNPAGVIFIGVNHPWLQKNRVEIIDTPGINDVISQRALCVDQALLYTDAAIITVSAVAPLSMTEVTFIQERLIARAIPRLMVCITKLDLVNEADRQPVIDYIHGKLKKIGVDAHSVFIVQDDVSIPGLSDKSKVGIQAIQNQLAVWSNDSAMSLLKRKSVILGVSALLNEAKGTLQEQLLLLDQSDEDRAKSIKEKEGALTRIESQWEDLRIMLMDKELETTQIFRKTLQEKKELIVERLQFELQHSNDPKQWWQRDYPYRLKLEMMNFATSLDDTLKRKYIADIAWFNEQLGRNFKQTVDMGQQDLAGKDAFSNPQTKAKPELKDYSKQRIAMRLGSSVLFMAGMMLFNGFGPLIAAGGGVAAEVLLNKDIGKQKAFLAKELESDIGRIMNASMASVDERISAAYRAAQERSKEKQLGYIAMQRDVIRQSAGADNKTRNAEIKTQLAKINAVRDSIVNLKVE